MPQELMNDFKIDKLCGTEELRKLAYLTDVPGIDRLSKSDLCTILQERVKNEVMQVQCENSDEPTMNGSNLSEIPAYLKFMVTGSNGKTYCYNVVDLYKEIQNGNKRDHFNRVELETIKEKVVSRYTKLREILADSALTDYFDEPSTLVSTLPNNNQSDKQILTDFWSRMYYPGLTIEEYLSLSDKEYQRFLAVLQSKGIRARPEEVLDRIVLIKNSFVDLAEEHDLLGFEFATRSFAKKYRERQDRNLLMKIKDWYWESMREIPDIFLYFDSNDIKSLSINALIKLRNDLGIDKSKINRAEILVNLVKIKDRFVVIQVLNEFFIAKFNIKEHLAEFDLWSKKHLNISVDELIKKTRCPADIYYEFVEERITCEDTFIDIRELEIDDNGTLVALLKKLVELPDDCLDDFNLKDEQADQVPFKQ